MVLEGDVIPEGAVLGWSEEYCNLLEVTALKETSPGSGAPGVEMEHKELYLHKSLREVRPYSGRRGNTDNATIIRGGQCHGNRS